MFAGEGLDVVMPADARGARPLADAHMQALAAPSAVAVPAAVGASVAVDVVQVQDGDVSARSDVTGQDSELLGGGLLAAVARGNAYGGHEADLAVSGSIDQTTTGEVRAASLGDVRYVPAPLAMTASATANLVQATTTGQSSQDLAIRQRSSGGMVEAASNPALANGWNLTARSAAAGNQASAYNEGGRQAVTVDQQNDATIRGAARAFAYDFGEAHVSADASANQALVYGVGNVVSLDAEQINTGGVSASATFDGAKGYDAYMGANASGNVFVGGCADCGGVTGTVRQTNSGAVSAQATTTVTTQGRTIIGGVTAVGNSATFTATGGR